MKPALTKEEWDHPIEKIDGYIDFDMGVVDVRLQGSFGTEEDSRHALAALCLHKQPFGFTREDVEMLREAAKDLPHHQGWFPDDEKDINSLADRLEALLPPEDE